MEERKAFRCRNGLHFRFSAVNFLNFMGNLLLNIDLTPEGKFTVNLVALYEMRQIFQPTNKM